MSDLFHTVALQALDRLPRLRPRTPGLFEPLTPFGGEAFGPHEADDPAVPALHAAPAAEADGAEAAQAGPPATPDISAAPRPEPSPAPPRPGPPGADPPVGTPFLAADPSEMLPGAGEQPTAWPPAANAAMAVLPADIPAARVSVTVASGMPVASALPVRAPASVPAETAMPDRVPPLRPPAGPHTSTAPRSPLRGQTPRDPPSPAEAAAADPGSMRLAVTARGPERADGPIEPEPSGLTAVPPASRPDSEWPAEPDAPLPGAPPLPRRARPAAMAGRAEAVAARLASSLEGIALPPGTPVEITIGRIDIRAEPTAASAPPKARPEPRISLTEYKGRWGRAR